MLNSSASFAAFYLCFAFPVGMFCLAAYDDHSTSLDAVAERQRLRRARLLVLLAPIHILFSISALGLVRDVERRAENSESNSSERARLRLSAGLGLVVGAGVVVGLAQAVG